MTMPQIPKRRKGGRQPRFPAGALLGFAQSDAMTQSLRHAGSSLQFSSMVSRFGVFAMQSGNNRSKRSAKPLAQTTSASASVPTSSASAAQTAPGPPAAAPAIAISSADTKAASVAVEPYSPSSSEAAALISSALPPSAAPARRGRGKKRAPANTKEAKRASISRPRPKKPRNGSDKDAPANKAATADRDAAKDDGKDTAAMQTDADPVDGDADRDAKEDKASKNFYAIQPDTEFCANCSSPVLTGEPAMQCQQCTRLVHSECGGLKASHGRPAVFRCRDCRDTIAQARM